MDKETAGIVSIFICAGIPFLAGVVFTVFIQMRVKALGFWGLIPLGGTIKKVIENRGE